MTASETVAAGIEQFVATSREALASAGLERVSDGGRVWWRGGHGSRVMVLLHGVNDQAGTWAPIVPALLKTFRVLAVDLAGHGESAPPEGPLPMTRILDDLDAILSTEDGPVTLVGNSMGGWVSMAYTLAHPVKVERLVLEDSSGISWPVSVPLVAASRADAEIIFRAVHGPAAVATPEGIDAILSRAASSPMTRVMQGGILAHLLDHRLDALRLPVAMIWGADDGLLPVAYAEALRAKIAGATLDVIDGAAHIPHRQQPERFLECLMATF